MITVPIGVRRLGAMLLLVAALGSLAARPAAAADLVTPLGDAKRTLAGPTGLVSFPVELTTAGRASTPQVAVTSVTRGSTAIGLDGISARLDPTAGHLTLTVGAAADLQLVGDYTVVVSLSAGTDRQRLPVTVVRPPAVVTAGGTVQITRMAGWLTGSPFVWEKSSYPDLNLLVDPAGGSLTTLTARQTESSAGQVIVNESRVSTAAPMQNSVVDGPPGATVALGYDLRDFPLGTTTRVVELRSPQLAAPVNVTFEVTRRFSAWWVAILTGVGLLFGWLTRTVLTAIIDAATRRRGQLELVEQIDGLAGAYEDDDFRQTLTELKATVTLEKTVSLAVIEQQRDAVGDALKLADDRLAAVRTENRTRSASIAGDWTLPAALANRLRGVARKLGDTEAALARHRLKTATTAAAALTSDLSTLDSELAEWLNRYRKAVVDLRPIAAAAPDRTEVTTLRRALDEQAAGEAPTERPVRLEAVHGALLDWRRDLRPAIEALVAADAGTHPDAAELTRVILVRPDPADALGALKKPLKELLTPPAAPPVPGPAPAPGIQLSQESSKSAGDAPATTVVLPTYPVSATEAATIYGARSRLNRASKAATALRLIILGLLACGAAYLIGADNWIGTRSQVATAFGWGFGLDLSVAAVTGLFGAASATPPTYAKAA